MLLEMAIGDSYGSSFEFVDQNFVELNNHAQGYVARKGRIKGRYTDDTQMSIAMAEAVLADDVFDRGSLAKRFVEVYKRDPREGYSRRFRALLDKVNNGKELLELIRPESDRSGSAMRSPPLGFLDSPKTVKRAAKVQSKITHDTPDGIRAATAAALMSHYFIYEKGLPKELGSWLESEVPGDWNEPWKGKVGIQGIQCVRAALTVVMVSSSFCEVLRNSIAFGGDVDTVAAIAMGSCASCKEMKNDLGVQFLDELENGAYGRVYLKDLDIRLLATVFP